ncbi:hypothetical protein [Streptomyces sp. URMC 125]|uniref:hypothetical protein n=1 Tax=Streptomyces sp. URMC 125 TaxID=3423419 RepID=UPI003F1C56B1
MRGADRGWLPFGAVRAGSIGTPRTGLLTGLEYLRNFEGAGFANLSGKLRIRLRETEAVVHVIRRGTPEPVMFNVFARINTGGEPLTRQEIRHALISGRARTLLAELAETEEFRRATGYSAVGDRMADREMVLRFLAFRMTSPTRTSPVTSTRSSPRRCTR